MDQEKSLKTSLRKGCLGVVLAGLLVGTWLVAAFSFVTITEVSGCGGGTVGKVFAILLIGAPAVPLLAPLLWIITPLSVRDSSLIVTAILFVVLLFGIWTIASAGDLKAFTYDKASTAKGQAFISESSYCRFMRL